jgi:bacterioferritin-associated ferredoxin
VIVCHCRCATDRRSDAPFARRDLLHEVGSRCGTAIGCGGCADAVVEIISAELGVTARAVDYDRASSTS